MNIEFNNCPICFLAYDQDAHRPELINPCGHTMCKQCLVQIHSNQKVCPICRNSIVSTIPNWQLIQNLSAQARSVNDEFKSIINTIDEVQTVYHNTLNLIHNEHRDLTNRIEAIKNEFSQLESTGANNSFDESRKIELQNQMSSCLITLKAHSDRLANSVKSTNLI